jgi:hypothetical protein
MTVDIKKKVLIQDHVILILIFTILGGVFLGLSFIITDPFFRTITVGFGISFITATIVTIAYRFISTRDFSDLVAENLLFNKQFLSTILNTEKKDALLKILLQSVMSTAMANLVKEQVIDKISKDQKDYVLYGVHYYFTLTKASSEKFKDYYKANIRQTYFEKIYTDQIFFYATNNFQFWELLGQKACNPKNGIELVWRMPTGTTQDILANESNIQELKEFFDTKVIINHIPLTPEYVLRKGESLKRLLGIATVAESDYCIEVRFSLSNLGDIPAEKEIEKYSEFDSYIFKHKNFMIFQTCSAFNKIHVDWDCTQTDIVEVTPLNTITDISQPVNRHPKNLKHSIISYSPYLPGQQIIYIWRFEEEKSLSTQSLLST